MLWEREESLADPATISSAAKRAGLDAAELRANGPLDAELDKLHDQYTNEALAAGVFGAPSYHPARYFGVKTDWSCWIVL